jgi:DNA polymerase-1
MKISCDTTLQERWDTFRKILLDKSLIKVTYQAQVALMPYHYHCAYDVSTDLDTGKFDDTTCHGIEKNEAMGYLDLVIPNLWDLRLASWMLTPHEGEENLELEYKKRGFMHIYPTPKYSRPCDASPQLIGLIQAKEDLEFLYTLYPTVDRLLERNGLKDAFCDIESPVQSVLSSMECFGVGFKPDRLTKIQEDLESRSQYLSSEAKTLTNDENFLISSPQQVSHLLFNKLGLIVPTNMSSQLLSTSQTKDHHISTSEECLLEIQREIKSREGKGLRIIDIILEFRAMNKILGTFIRPYLKLARGGVNQMHSRKISRRSKKKNINDFTTQKLHPMWMQTSVQTGRLSCRKPNMQQVPAGSIIKGVYPRNFFASSTPDWCLFSCDYSQNEVRILAHMSNDESLIRLFTQPGAADIYKLMAAVISGKDPGDVTDEERAVSKQVTLAIMYGMGINTVAKKLNVNKLAAKTFFQSFYGRFHGVKNWMDSTIGRAKKDKYVTTITGRRRYVQNFVVNNCEFIRQQFIKIYSLSKIP